MAQLPDGAPCDYLPGSAGSTLVAIGWLDSEWDFTRGRVEAAFFRRLCEHLKARWKPPFACAGYHQCNLCQFSQASNSQFESHSFSSQSNGELFIPNGRDIFVAPLSIAHYIDAHVYQPPGDFIDAVMACPEQRSRDYLKLLLHSGGREWLKSLEER
jgi:hypothetical protein